MKYLKKPACTFALYGDGAANQGQVFEAFNMAALWKLPIIFGCENNKYGMVLPHLLCLAYIRERQRRDRRHWRSIINVDNISPVLKLMVWMSSQWHTQVNLLGTTPSREKDLWLWSLLPTDTVYSYGDSKHLIVGGHSMSDPGTTYRTREEIQNMRSSNDAIQGLKSKLLEWGIVAENELKVPLFPWCCRI